MSFKSKDIYTVAIFYNMGEFGNKLYLYMMDANICHFFILYQTFVMKSFLHYLKVHNYIT